MAQAIVTAHQETRLVLGVLGTWGLHRATCLIGMWVMPFPKDVHHLGFMVLGLLLKRPGVAPMNEPDLPGNAFTTDSGLR